MLQRWEQLLFLHWHFDPEVVQATLPRGLHVDCDGGRAWVGVVPFFMRGVRPRFAPAIGWLSDFLELNVRTYVHDPAGRPGIYFYSLDCNQPVAVEAARRLFHLRYEHATMTAAASADGWVEYAAQRAGAEESSHFRYRASGAPEPASEGSQLFFLLERYRLFATDTHGEQLQAMRVWHTPYRIRPVEVVRWSDLPLRQAGFISPQRAPDHWCMADSVEVEAFSPERVEGGSLAGST